MYVHVHGARFPDDLMYGSILFTGRRVGEVIEVFSKFKEFKALIENQTERDIKTLRLDNGGEFTLE